MYTYPQQEARLAQPWAGYDQAVVHPHRREKEKVKAEAREVEKEPARAKEKEAARAGARVHRRPPAPLTTWASAPTGERRNGAHKARIAASASSGNTGGAARTKHASSATTPATHRRGQLRSQRWRQRQGQHQRQRQGGHHCLPRR